MGNVLDCSGQDRDAPRETTEFDSLFRYELDAEKKALTPEGIKRMIDLAKHPEKRLEEERRMFAKFDNACKETLDEIFEKFDEFIAKHTPNGHKRETIAKKLSTYKSQHIQHFYTKPEPIARCKMAKKI